MQDKEYIMVGAPLITREIFRKTLRPLNNYGFKPSGGFWASKHVGNIGYISDWYAYLLDADSIARYKNLNQGTIFTLKDNVQILIIDSYEQVLELARKYPSYHHLLGYYDNIDNSNTIFDFEKLSKDYDGIYIDFNYFNNQMNTTVFDTFSVSSLLLFNLDCIREYRSAYITFDIDNPYSFPYIKDNSIGNPQKVEEESHEHQVLSHIVKELFLNLISKYHNYSFTDYDEYLTIMLQNLKVVIHTIEEAEDKKITEISKYLEGKGMHVKKDLIVQNLVLNFLAEYLRQDEKRIKTLPKTKVKSPKQYSIL